MRNLCLSKKKKKNGWTREWIKEGNWNTERSEQVKVKRNVKVGENIQERGWKVKKRSHGCNKERKSEYKKVEIERRHREGSWK